MNVPLRHLPWIGGAADAARDASFSPLVSPIDETVASEILESDAAVIDAAVKHAHAACLKHQQETPAKRIEWLLAVADAFDKIEAELVRSLIRVIGKPKHGLSGVELGGVRRSSQGAIRAALATANTGTRGQDIE
jgi:acyl-CoA reductase-like NAD-dependent aldehyde dehydrogenase